MAGAECLLCPSRNEGQGLVLLEAGALGTPVICSSIGPFMMITENGRSAVKVPPDDADSLAEAVVRITNDRALGHGLGQALRKRVQDHFSAERMVSDYVTIYRQLLSVR
jgi:glycosyltransferase involved in cell wall biosynthesis